MNKKIYLPATIIFLVAFISFSAFTGDTGKAAGDFKYIGVDKCAGMCHKGDAKGKQLEIWQESKHSQAYTVLTTPEADKIAKDKGFTTAAAETPQCVKCHTLGKELVEAELDATFDKTKGVQCETCHGPGSAYKSMSIMKDHAQAVANGLLEHSDKAAFCTTCHNADSPTFKAFNFDEAWAKIQHPKK
ncbi:MAG: cytochrome C554 [Ignavibacteriae bacterium]|nr:MAG: cytochrome C554 [Ignavibacteriota bacterium]